MNMSSTVSVNTNENRGNRLKGGTIILLAYIAHLLVIPIIVQMINPELTINFSLLTGVLSILLAVAVNKKYNLALFSGKFYLSYVGLIVAAVIFLYAKAIVLTLMFPTNQGTLNGNMLQEMLESNIWAMAISTAIIAPILEEIVFRGVMIGLYSKNRGLLSCVISTFIFTLIHVPTDLMSWLNYGLIGITFCFVYVKTNNLKVSIWTHLINNSIAAVMMVVPLLLAK